MEMLKLSKSNGDEMQVPALFSANYKRRTHHVTLIEMKYEFVTAPTWGKESHGKTAPLDSLHLQSSVPQTSTVQLSIVANSFTKTIN
ncbi:hypothetical protein AVEN_37961-1 [Araneus ventricosus]|uniref:Uncharacterized protein n=1 Tax=Araneus ventricosus TaxID=182803 RepID=A0A4Y2PST6_ARAVE|nr:hypothetical protein AVEN_37961-1 [Araneus ventricosus]